MRKGRLRVAGVLLAFVQFVGITTDAASSEENRYRFVVIGDNRSGDGVYEKVVHAAMQRHPDFLVNTGDLIPHPGNRSQWKNFWRLSKPITVPYYLTPGNHDIDDVQSQQVWRDEVQLPDKETYYHFVKGQDLFVVLNSCEPGHDRKIEGEQFAWLKRVLDPKRYRHQFVFLHHPLFLWDEASYKGKSLDRYPKARDALHALFKERGVDAVFAGHEHTYRRMDVDGIRYIVTGGAGAPLYSGFNHFMLVEVDGDVLAAKVIDRKGALQDEFVLGLVPASVKAPGTAGLEGGRDAKR